MKLVEQIVEGEYTTNIYDNGASEKFLTEYPPKIYVPPLLSETQEIVYRTAANMEMLLALTELNIGIG